MGPVIVQPELVVPGPPGAQPGRVDEKGRLKFTSEICEFLKGLKETVVYCTTVDLRVAQVYPLCLWKHNEIFFRNFRDDIEDAEDMAYLATYYGGTSEIDGSSRILLPTRLRRKLELENQMVELHWFGNSFKVYGEKLAEESLNRASLGAEDRVKRLRKQGFV